MTRGAFILTLLLAYLWPVLVANATPRARLQELLERVYPERWSGRIAWFYTPDRSVVRDLHDANVRRHDVVYFDSRDLKFVRGAFEFDGSEHVFAVYDGQLHVAFGPSGHPTLQFPDFNALGRESCIFAYLFLAAPDEHTVEEVNGNFVVRQISGFDVTFDRISGFVASVGIDEYDFAFDEHTLIDGCPWPLRCRITDSRRKDEDPLYLYASVEATNLTSRFFDYARFYKNRTYDDSGRRIVFLGRSRLLASDARTRAWPETRTEWQDLISATSGDSPVDVSSSWANPRPTTPRIARFSHRTLFWVGLFATITGLLGIYLYRRP